MEIMHLSMLRPREGTGGGGRSKHGSLIVRYVPIVGILIVCDVPRLAILPPGGHFDQLFCPRGGEFDFFFF